MDCTGCIHEKICELWCNAEAQNASCYDDNCKETLAYILGDDYDPDRLKELVEADREGKLFETPFKIGTHIFEINDGNIGEWEVIGFSFGVPYLRVFGSHNYKNEVFVIAKGITVDGRMRFQFTLSEIGEKVFLSQKEAEAALEKMKEDK